MSGKITLVGLICTIAGLFFSIYVYVDTSSKRADAAEQVEAVGDLVGVDVETQNQWVREEGKR